jgi:hypothetical protein
VYSFNLFVLLTVTEMLGTVLICSVFVSSNFALLLPRVTFGSFDAIAPAATAPRPRPKGGRPLGLAGGSGSTD